MKDFEPNIIAFLCNWCTYAGADLAGTTRLKYPPNVKIIRVMCTSRINPLFIVNSFQQGADGVLIGGCHPGDCHYNTGNMLTRRRFQIMRNLLEYIGIDPKRIRIAWVSASEGQKYAKIMKEITKDIKKIGPINDIKRGENW